MKLLTYRQAAEKLSCTYQTIRFAVTEGRLTQVATQKGPRLLEKQVDLFIGKASISERFLNLEEKSLWEEYKKSAESYLPSEQSTSIGEILKNMESRQNLMEEKFSSLEKISNVMDECIKLIRSVAKETNIELPKELEENFPRLPLVHK